MYKLSLVLLLAIQFILPSYAGIQYNNYSPFRTSHNSTKPKFQNNYNHYKTCRPINNHNYYGNYNHNLNALERYALKKNFRRENNLSRLERLENLAFGATQFGDYDTRFRNVEAAILSRPQHNYKRSVLGNIANFFAGQATGYTPNISTDYMNLGSSSAFSPNYSNNIVEQYSNGIFGSGFRQFGNDFGNGSSIRILD